MRIRLGQWLLISGTLLAGAGLFWFCRFSEQTSFLPKRAPAQWIVYPKPAVPHLQAVAELPTVFQRTFQLNQVPASAFLAVSACRRCEIFINEKPVPLAATARHWKQLFSLAIEPYLKSGENHIRVTVWNQVGPPALWLSLTGSDFQVNTDKSWQASYAGAVWRSAQLATEPPYASAGNPLRGGLTPFHAFKDHWRLLAALGLIAAAIVLAGRWWFARPVSPLPARWLWLQDPAALLMVLIAVLWLLLIPHNLGLIPRHIGFDTDGHLEYISYIQSYLRLPPVDQGWETHQPPLYYFLAGGILSACGVAASTSDGLAILRLLSLLIGLAHVAFIFLSLRLLFPRDPSKQLIGLTLAGFLPMQLYLAHYVTNETLVACLISATIYLLLRLLATEQYSWKLFAGIGACLGLALLTKVTAFILLPFALAAFVCRAYQSKARGPNCFLGPAIALALCLAICAWHYLGIWRQFGHPLFAETRWAFGVSWWQDPGYRTAAYFARFGQALLQPFFSGSAGFSDGLYSTLWGDGLVSGAAGWRFFPPWNYGLMAASFWLALLPTAMLAVGFVAVVVNVFRNPRPIWLGLLGFCVAIFLAMVHLNLVVPSYAVAKSFYGLSALVVWSAFACIGWEFFRRRKWMATVTATALVLWALASYASFWIDGRSPTTQAMVGRGLMRSGQHALAMERFQRALQRNPSHLAARSFLFASLLQQGKFAEAHALALETSKAHPNHASAHLDLAAAMEVQGQREAAIAETKLAVEIEPDNPDARLRLASRLFRGRAYAEAIPACRQALRLGPADPELHLILGCALAAAAKSPSMSRDLVDADPLWPGTNPAAAPGEVVAAQAINYLGLSLKLSPNLVDSLNSLAWILSTHPAARLRNGPEALRLAQRACTLTSFRDPRLLATLASAYAETGQFTPALQTAQQGAQLAASSGAREALAINDELIERFSKQQPFRQTGNGE